ncbi:three component ABC system middle component [Micromonospora haikouensis]|uniref:three component ABC system middle component n=1 Tax=Micromonospora haikouensis TaxID=686309 RepID=UPI0036C61C0B
MIQFDELSREERALYSPTFTGLTIARSVQGYQFQYEQACPIVVAVLSTVMAMQPSIRHRIPATIRSGLTRWLEENQAVRLAMMQNAEGLAAVVRPGLLMVLQAGLVQVNLDGHLFIPPGAIKKTITGGTDEVLEVQRAAYAFGRWLPSTGSLSTVMTLLGVRP